MDGVRDQPLWRPTPERAAGTNMARFMAEAGKSWNKNFSGMETLHRWSVEAPEEFWRSVWDWGGVIAETRGKTVLRDGGKMPGAQFFPDARLNFAENLLCKRDATDALVFRGEDKVKRRLSWNQLYDQVSLLSQAMKADGIGPGDRVAGYLPNMPEAVIGMLAASSIGAVWSSCSPDFGVKGVLDRFGQIEPKLLLVAEGYYYGGKSFDCLDKTREIAAALPSLKRIVVVPYTGEDSSLQGLPIARHLAEYLAPYRPSEIEFIRLPFGHPLYVMYSSGTTGVPKCIIHGAGGTLLKHIVEQQFHCDLKPGDRLFYFTTCGWMMWNWLASGLSAGATLLLYDGSPFYPSGKVLFDYADAGAHDPFRHLGQIHRFLPQGRARADGNPQARHGAALDLDRLAAFARGLRLRLSRHQARSLPRLDLGRHRHHGLFRHGQSRGPGLARRMRGAGAGHGRGYFPTTTAAAPPTTRRASSSAPSPSPPCRWDSGTIRMRRNTAPPISTASPISGATAITPRARAHGGFVIYGRSDAVLNPGGVRIGTAEIYRQVEQIPEVLESLVIAQDWLSDVRVVLFVKLREGAKLDDGLIARINKKIRANASPRHVPARTVQVGDIPRTKSGKIVELAVREVVHGRPVKNREALANPEALDFFRDRPELRA